MNLNEAKIEMPMGMSFERGFPMGASIYTMAMKLFGTCEDVVAMVRCPEGSDQKWEIVPKDKWQFIKPRPGKNAVKFNVVPKGGAKNIIAAILVVVIAIAAPYLAPLIPGVVAGTLTATLVATAITIGGSLLVSSLFAPSQTSKGVSTEADNQSNAIANVDSDSNAIAKGARLARVLGEREVSPHDVCEPERYLEGGREVITRVLGLDGEHVISDLKVNGVDIDQLVDAEYEITDGADTTAAQKLVNRVASNTVINKSLSKFTAKASDNALTDQASPANSEPKPVIFAPGYHKNMEEIRVRLSISPLVNLASASVSVMYPMRISFWKKSDPNTVYKVPEIHVYGRKTSDELKEVKFRWDDNFGVATGSKDYLFRFIADPPAPTVTLSDGTTGKQWTPHSHFLSGSSVVNITVNGDSINIKLDEDTFPKDDYEFSILGGQPINTSSFDPTTYQIAGAVRSLFVSHDVGGIWVIPEDNQNAAGGISVQFATMVVNEPPIQTTGVASIGLKLRDIDAENITVKAGAKVLVHTGTPWTTRAVSRNPGDHAYNIMKEWLELFRADPTLLNADAFQAWAEECASRNYECSFVATGQSVFELVDILCTAGFATKRIDTGYSVDYFRDRSSDTPEMTFSHKDSKISIDRPFPETPSGIRARYKNKARNWKDDEVVVNNEFGQTPFPENEVLDYPSIDDFDQLLYRVYFDLLQSKYRNKRWRVTTGPAGFNMSKGDLINVVTDLNSKFTHGFSVLQVPNSTTIVVDREVPVSSAGADVLTNTDMLAITDMIPIGEVSMLHLLTPNGVEAFTISSITDNVITLQTAISYIDLDKLIGSRVTVAPRAKLFNRCLVLDVQRQKDQKAVLICVDEAPEIKAFLDKRFGR